jgi:hypothetical protein
MGAYFSRGRRRHHPDQLLIQPNRKALVAIKNGAPSSYTLLLYKCRSGARHMAGVLRRCPHLRELYLEHDGYTRSQDARNLAQTIRGLTQLEVVHIHMSYVTDTDLDVIIEALKALSRIQVLHVSTGDVLNRRYVIDDDRVYDCLFCQTLPSITIVFHPTSPTTSPPPF